MTWEMFMRHMAECNVMVFDNPVIERVVIRGLEDDFELAAVHRSPDGKTLILDLGQAITARGLEGT